jgi:hypothetical protein
MARYLVALISLLFSLNACAQVFSVETAMAELPVHPKGDNNVFATSFDYRDGKIFLVYVAPSNEPENGMNLRTIVRKGYGRLTVVGVGRILFLNQGPCLTLGIPRHLSHWINMGTYMWRTTCITCLGNMRYPKSHMIFRHFIFLDRLLLKVI